MEKKCWGLLLLFFAIAILLGRLDSHDQMHYDNNSFFFLFSFISNMLNNSFFFSSSSSLGKEEGCH